MMKDNLFKSGLIALLDCTFSLLINEFHKQNEYWGRELSQKEQNDAEHV